MPTSCYKIIIAIILPNKNFNDSETVVKHDIIYTAQLKKIVSAFYCLFDHKQKIPIFKLCSSFKLWNKHKGMKRTREEGSGLQGEQPS